MKNILLLDDDPLIHQLVSKIIHTFSYNSFPALTPAEALQILKDNNIDFAICDLFLEGDLGDQLSNEFIRQELVPRKIAYARLTSAPNLVPSDCVGQCILDKREFYHDDFKLYELLASII